MEREDRHCFLSRSRGNPLLAQRLWSFSFILLFFICLLYAFLFFIIILFFYFFIFFSLFDLGLKESNVFYYYYYYYYYYFNLCLVGYRLIVLQNWYITMGLFQLFVWII